MRLADFIQANTEPILAEWEEFARGIWPGGATDPTTLRDDAEELLLATVADMGASQSDREQHDKSHGNAVASASSVRVKGVSASHGVGRVGSGFDLNALIAEYRALRASVIRLWQESIPGGDVNDLSDVTRFNECIDQSLTEAVVAHSRYLERDRLAAFDEQKARSQELRELNNKLLVSSVRQHELTEEAVLSTVALREAKEHAESAGRAKDTFLAVLSHELRTPLTPVVMTISSFESDPDMHFKFREDLAMVRRNIDLEVKLIDDLLDLSRVTSGKLRLQLQNVRVHELLSHVLRSSLSETYGKHLQVRTEFHASNDRLLADPGRLQQICWNLVRNALKFTPEGGQVIVRTWNSEDDEHLHVEIRDTGVGIDPELLPRVFDAFQQGEAGVARQFGGLGLGLAIAKAVTEMHGGTITAASEGRNRGAAFTLSLKTENPIGSSHETRSLPFGSAFKQSQAHARILLVEDHRDTARILAKLLKGSGYEVTTVHTVESALHAAATRAFDIVVSDVGLPDATGYELMTQIRDRHGLTGIALSGYAMEEDFRKSRESGFVEHLVKPISISQLDTVIQRAMGPGRS